MELASILGRDMPESYEGEHLNWAETIRDGTVQGIYQVCAKRLVFAMSNSLHHHPSVFEWEFVADMLRRFKILETPQDPASLTSEPTLRAFAERLFRGAVFQFVSGHAHQSAPLKAEAWAVIEWFVSSGLFVEHGELASTALDLALQGHKFGLTALLIVAGATLDATPRDISSRGRRRGLPLHEFIQGLTGRLNSKNREEAFGLVRSMLRSGARLDARDSGESALMAAIPVGDAGLIDLLIGHGAEILTSKAQNDVFQDEDSVLTRCAGYTLGGEGHFTLQLPDEKTARDLLLQILGALERQFPDCPIGKHIKADVIMAAAGNNYVTVMELLRERAPSTNVQTTSGATPLHAAAFHGYIEMCELLLGWGHPADEASLAGLTPLHLACLGGHSSVVRLLIRHGVDLDRGCVIERPARILLAMRLSKILFQRGRRFTPLMIALESHSAPTRGGADCAIQLLKAGVRPHRNALLVGVMNADGVLFDMLLSQGADPGASCENRTVLQRALMRDQRRPFAVSYPVPPLREVERRVQILLDRGAMIVGGEISAAVALGSWELVMSLSAAGASCSGTGPYGERYLELALLSNAPGLPETVDVFSAEYDAGALCAATRAALLPAKENQHWVETILRRRPVDVILEPMGRTALMEGSAFSMAIRDGNYDMIELFLRFINPPPALAVLPFLLRDISNSSRHTDPRLIGGPRVWADGGGLSGPWDKTANFWRSERRCSRGSPMTIAVAMGDIKLVEWLLNRRFVVDRLSLATAAANSCVPLLELLIKAVKHMPSQLEELQTKPDHPERDPIYWAISHANGDIFRLLREVNACTQSAPYDRLICGRSNLQNAAEVGSLEIVKLLIDAGASVNEPPGMEGGATSLQLAAIKGHLRIAKYLIDRGANINAAGAKYGGRTALEGAAEHGRIDMVHLLLEGAETTGKGQRQYLRAVKLAKKEGHFVVADQLRAHRPWTKEDEDMFANLWDAEAA